MIIIIHLVIAEETDREGCCPMLCGHPSDDGSDTDSEAFSIYKAKLTHCIQRETEFFDVGDRVTNIGRQSQTRTFLIRIVYISKVECTGEAQRNVLEAVTNFRSNLKRFCVF